MRVAQPPYAGPLRLQEFNPDLGVRLGDHNSLADLLACLASVPGMHCAGMWNAAPSADPPVSQARSLIELTAGAAAVIGGEGWTSASATAFVAGGLQLGRWWTRLLLIVLVAPPTLLPFHLPHTDSASAKRVAHLALEAVEVFVDRPLGHLERNDFACVTQARQLDASLQLKVLGLTSHYPGFAVRIAEVNECDRKAVDVDGCPSAGQIDVTPSGHGVHQFGSDLCVHTEAGRLQDIEHAGYLADSGTHSRHHIEVDVDGRLRCSYRSGRCLRRSLRVLGRFSRAVGHELRQDR
ncbi:hypothetical protein EDD33_3475 [Nocardioides aurantiacus]|uniref:Uncharacterized protein n=1 Tax=Nocardioides aurantiacus TaxID=86796 RepID=A0A3N2CZG1_9ACTN|nr:hypothetical protein EDD33_3475 [Nocardioides aurantiacus]